jgi:hypothetical protein
MVSGLSGHISFFIVMLRQGHSIWLPGGAGDGVLPFPATFSLVVMLRLRPKHLAEL